MMDKLSQLFKSRKSKDKEDGVQETRSSRREVGKSLNVEQEMTTYLASSAPGLSLPGISNTFISEAAINLATTADSSSGSKLKQYKRRNDTKQASENCYLHMQTQETHHHFLPNNPPGLNNMSFHHTSGKDFKDPLRSHATGGKKTQNQTSRRENKKKSFLDKKPVSLVTLIKCGEHRKLYSACKGRRDANYCDTARNTLLMFAAIKGDDKCIKFLLDKGADVNRQNKNGVTALMYAVFYNKEATVRLLLQHDANTICCTEKGDTAVEIATWKGHYECLHLILQSQIDRYNCEYIDKERAVSIAVARNQNNCLTMFVQYSTVVQLGKAVIQQDIQRNYSNQELIVNALMTAASYGSMECMEILFNEFMKNINITDHTGSSALMYAAWSGQKEVLKKLTVYKALVNHVNNFGSTALMMAAYRGHWECCAILLNNGADCNFQTTAGTAKSMSRFDEGHQLCGMSALMFAVQGDHPTCVELLLRGKSTDVNQQNSLGETALMLSVINNRVECFDLLMRSGCDVNIPDNTGTTPLTASLTMKQTKMASSLVQKISLQLLNILDKNDQTPLMRAVMTDQQEVMGLLLRRRVSTNFKHSNDETALMLAVILGSENCVQKLIDAGADVNISDVDGNTPLMEAARSGNVKILQLLLHARGEVNSANLAGQTPLMKAAREGNYECVQELVTTAHVNQPDPHGLTALMFAAGHGNTECVEILIKHDANVNVHDDGGVTPLMMAAVQGYSDCAQILIKAGAEVNQADNDGVTALMNAALGGHKQILQMLLENGASPNMKNKHGETAYTYTRAYEKEDCGSLLAGEELFDLVKHGRSKKLQRLLRMKVNIDEADENGETALMTAAWYNQTDCLQHLFTAGANADVKNPDGATALNLASARGNLDCIRHLIKYKADVNHCDNFGFTPLMEAAAGGFNSCMQELLKAGADVDYQGFESNTALILAAERGHRDCVNQLLATGADVSLKNNQGITAFSTALKNHNLECCTEIANKGYATSAVRL